MTPKDRYLIVIEKTNTGFSAYSPDVLGCIATGDTISETKENMRLALKLHLETIIQDGEEIPQPGGVQSYLTAQSDSEGEEYYLSHITINSIIYEQVTVYSS